MSDPHRISRPTFPQVDYGISQTFIAKQPHICLAFSVRASICWIVFCTRGVRERDLASLSFLLHSQYFYVRHATVGIFVRSLRSHLSRPKICLGQNLVVRSLATERIVVSYFSSKFKHRDILRYYIEPNLSFSFHSPGIALRSFPVPSGLHVFLNKRQVTILLDLSNGLERPCQATTSPDNGVESPNTK